MNPRHGLVPDKLYHDTSCFTHENSSCAYFRLSLIVKIRQILIFKGENGMAKVAKIPGKKVSAGGNSAFMAAPLPSQFEWTTKLIGALSDADRLIGRLAGEGGASRTLTF